MQVFLAAWAAFFAMSLAAVMQIEQLSLNNASFLDRRQFDSASMEAMVRRQTNQTKRCRKRADKTKSTKKPAGFPSTPITSSHTNTTLNLTAAAPPGSPFNNGTMGMTPNGFTQGNATQVNGGFPQGNLPQGNITQVNNGFPQGNITQFNNGNSQGNITQGNGSTSQGNITQGNGGVIQQPDEPPVPGTGRGGGGSGNGSPSTSSGRPSISIGPHQPWKPMPTSPQRTKTCQGSCSSIQSDIQKCNNGGHVVISGSCSISSFNLRGLSAIDIEIVGAITVSGEGFSGGGEDALLTFQGSDVNIFGTGSINGNGPSYWSRGKNSKRPHLMKVVLSGGSVSQLHLVDSPMFFLVVVQSENVVISDLKLDARASGGEAYNTDGIDPSGSDNIVIQNCVINNDDDCVAIKAGCSNILVQGMSCTHSHGISIGSLSGSDTVQHVLVSNCRFSGGLAAARIKTKPGGGGGGLVSDVTYENIQVSGGYNAIEINQCYENAGACKSSPSSVKIQNVHFRGFTGDATANMHVADVNGKVTDSAIGLISCGAAGSCSDITMSDIRVSSKGGSAGKLACSNAPALDMCAR